MMRLVLFGLASYLAFRIGREFIESVPAEFEPTPARPGRAIRPETARPVGN